MARLFARLVLAAALIAALPAASHADRRGGRDERSSAGFTISRETAEATARAGGMVQIREFKARRGVWKFEGFDAEGRKLEISINGVTGEVVKREVYGTGNSSRSSSRSKPNQ